MLKIIISFAAVLIPAVVFAASLDKIQFIKISAQESKTVIKAADGKMQVVKPGDTIVDNTTIKEIAPGRIVLEEKTERGMETIIVKTASNTFVSLSKFHISIVP